MPLWLRPKKQQHLKTIADIKLLVLVVEKPPVKKLHHDLLYAS